jgi:hypothetical protein
MSMATYVRAAECAARRLRLILVVARSSAVTVASEGRLNPLPQQEAERSIAGTLNVPSAVSVAKPQSIAGWLREIHTGSGSDMRQPMKSLPDPHLAYS